MLRAKQKCSRAVQDSPDHADKCKGDSGFGRGGFQKCGRFGELLGAMHCPPNNSRSSSTV
ncbi:hypothetical protein M3J09_004083 [Ascochyta lentis]